MKPAGRCQWAGITGPVVIAGSLLLAMTIILLSTHQVPTVGVVPNAWLPPQLLGRPIESPSLPFHNITGQILAEMKRNGTGLCYDQNTNSTKVIGFPEHVEILTLSTNVAHKLWLQSYTKTGERRCAGGDYYELDLSSSLWKSRPPSHDLQNGTYAVELLVPEEYAGEYNFSAFLLFDAYHGLDFNGETWSIKTLTASLHIKFVNDSSAILETNPNLRALQPCGFGDFQRLEWSGRWSRPLENDSCLPNAEGRYPDCFSENTPCRNPSWCNGNVAILESVGWSYSAHCTFKIFQPNEAWNCLAGRWLFFWGDSNHQDTIRNLLTFILQICPPPGRDFLHFAIDRSYQNWFRNPDNRDQEVRISSHYNGHPQVDANGAGLASLEDVNYRKYVTDFFSGKTYPDTVIMNSGLHDGSYQQNVATYLKTVDMAMQYWKDVFGNLTDAQPVLVYRTTVAPAGESRGMQSNAQKMEIFNRIVTEQVQRTFPRAKIVDAFDMSYPFHYDNRYSDGGHYGRAPDVERPHFYFVDVMLAHILLNAICPNKNN